jgi:hypothetical protein
MARCFAGISVSTPSSSRRSISSLSPFICTKRCAWTLAQYLAYLGTWSATQRYVKATGVDPIERIAPEFAAAWGDAPTRTVRWPLVLRVGRVA